MPLFHLFVKRPDAGFTAESMSERVHDVIAYGDHCIQVGQISNYEVFESESTDWKEAWTSGRSVHKASIKGCHSTFAGKTCKVCKAPGVREVKQ